MIIRRNSFAFRVFQAAICLLAAAVVLPARAQLGDQSDSAGVKQTPRVSADKIPPAPPLEPDKALASFALQPGFRIELVASEPLVHDPICIRFDTRGRIWVVEMSGYMPNPDGIGEDQPVGKIAVLEDTDGDGKMDKRTEFLTGLVMPGAIALATGGVLVGAPPHLWFCRDTDGDLKCDTKMELARDFSVAGNPQHTPNGLVWALDNWIYTAGWPFRLKRLATGEWQREPTVPRGQYGLSQDDAGRLVYNSNEDQFRIDLISSHYLQRNSHYRTGAGLNVDPIKDQTTWPARVNPAVNRGYRAGILRDDGTLAHFTAACSPLIYRGNQFPDEFYGNAFVCEPAGNLIKRNILWEENGTLHGKQAYSHAEFLTSTDERFRPVSLANAPDGSLYIVDFYHGLLEHRISLTSYLRHQTEARSLDKPTGMGRIYRVVHTGRPLQTLPTFSRSNRESWVQLLNHPNGWVRETVQRLLVESRPATTVAPLRKLATEGTNAWSRLHALWTLDGMAELDEASVLANLDAKNSKVRVAAVRLSENFLRGEEASQFIERLSGMAQREKSADVRLQLALTLGQTTDAIAEKAMIQMARAPGGGEELTDALLSGLYNRERPILEGILKDLSWPKDEEDARRFIAGLAHCIVASRNAANVEVLLQSAADSTGPIRTALLQGAAEAAPSIIRSASRGPIRLGGEPFAWRMLKASDLPGDAKRVATIERAISWPGLPNYVAPPIVVALNAAQQSRFSKGQELFAATCAGCHQTDGQGLAGLAPPLADSEWVLGSEQRLARIVLLGVHGPLNVNGRTFDLEMPSMANLFNDDQIAGILTYVRRAWDHTAMPVEPATIKSIRLQLGKRTESWTEAELKAVP
ncbi:MAG TPA: c-type cytochrome [Candidatus Limnocylindria bacterium]|nr:c-type cytochrome [Candidatus Limnocylindria bacterium]